MSTSNRSTTGTCSQPGIGRDTSLAAFRVSAGGKRQLPMRSWGWMLLAALLLLAGRAHATEECNGFIDISYPGSPVINNIGDVLTIEIHLGAGTITGGPLNVLNVTSFGFDLSCVDPPGPFPDCVSEGPVMSYNGDASITTNCPGTVTTNNPGGGATPSHLVFTFTPNLSIPHDTPIPPDFCDFFFSETILAQSTNATGVIEQVIGYDVAECDNGVLLSGGFQTGSVPVASPVTHFSCFEVTKGALKPKIPVTVVDRFGTNNPILTEVHRICAPADKNGEDPTAPANPNHEAAYELTGASSAVVAQGLKVTNQFGTFTMDVRGLKRLLVPTSKKLTAPPGPPLPLNIIRHYACHDISNLSGPDISKKAVTVVDQFATTPIPGFTAKSKWSLCVAANKNNEDPTAPTDNTALMCFFAGKTPPFGTVPLFLNNQFGPNQFANQPRATQFDELCVPSNILP